MKNRAKYLEKVKTVMFFIELKGLLCYFILYKYNEMSREIIKKVMNC